MGPFLDLARRIRAVDFSDRHAVAELEIEVQILAAPYRSAGETRYRSSAGNVVTRYAGGTHGTSAAPRYLSDVKDAFRLLWNVKGFFWTLIGRATSEPWNDEPTGAKVAADDGDLDNVEDAPNPAAALTAAILQAMGECDGEVA